MPRYDFRSPRICVDAVLAAGAVVPLGHDQGHYLTHVLRLAGGDAVLAFNGRDGEWRAAIGGSKRSVSLTIGERTRPQDSLPDLRYVFAPLKHARLDYMVQKAVELGARALLPVITRHTQVARVNTARMRANVIEAAEQCGILSLAEVAEPCTLETFLVDRDRSRALVFCDEDAEVTDPVAALAALRGGTSGIDVLIGPEGGFAADERKSLAGQPATLRLALGPRILRADTAAVAALALVQAAWGDWR
ncbi:MAG: 16S rRNA (uracil(1498)-N(3))-methyltransferase [Xanthobacteraceae bacterium]|nr:MAG: 16S rRNA (uracil(1498)-N(3))-methyltransferase [Xanthobacteraceae bacterium]